MSKVSRSKPHDTEVDRMLADPRLSQVLDTFVERARANRPVRWHRLIHRTLKCQMGAGPDLALLTESKWRLARAGIDTDLESAWLTFDTP